MKRAFGVVCIICVIYLAALMIGFYRYELREQNEIEQLLLSYAIDYSADGAMEEAINSRDVNTDYMAGDGVKLDPDVVLNHFLDIFCFNYDIGRSIEAKKYVTQNFIPVACVAGFDGYYIAKLQPVKSDVDAYFPKDMLLNSRWDLVFGPKMPYTYTINHNSYALNMGMEYAYTTQGGKYEGLVTGLHNKQAGLIKINKILTSAIENSISSANATNTNWEHRFFIPAEFSSSCGINPIIDPSFIIFVQNLDLRTTKPVSGFSISGSKVEKGRTVIGYMRKGIKYYCYADIAPGMGTDEILNIFSSVEEAAEAGYYCDLTYMQ